MSLGLHVHDICDPCVYMSSTVHQSLALQMDHVAQRSSHNGHTLGVNGTEVAVLEEAHLRA